MATGIGKVDSDCPWRHLNRHHRFKQVGLYSLFSAGRLFLSVILPHSVFPAKICSASAKETAMATTVLTGQTEKINKNVDGRHRRSSSWYTITARRQLKPPPCSTFDTWTSIFLWSHAGHDGAQRFYRPRPTNARATAGRPTGHLSSWHRIRLSRQRRFRNALSSDDRAGYLG